MWLRATLPAGRAHEDGPEGRSGVGQNIVKRYW